MKEKRVMTDLDLPEAYRTQANYWKAKYFEAYKELVNANKGLRRLNKRLAYYKSADRPSLNSDMFDMPVAPEILKKQRWLTSGGR